MKKMGLMGLVGLMFLGPTTSAGLYLPGKPDPYPMPTKPEVYLKFALGDRQKLLVYLNKNAWVSAKITDDEKKEAERIQTELATLQGKEKEGQLSVKEATQLGAWYLLLGKPNDALTVLSEAQKREPTNFMVIANLATAYHNQGLLDRAVSYQEQLLSNSVWPKQVESWTADRLRKQRRAEVAYLNLLRARHAESLRNPAGSRGELTLDNLFPNVRFVGRGGKYVAGEISPAMQDRLPADATALVEQILLWHPNDERLTWLLAELFNAQGDIVEAALLMNNLRGRGVGGELHEHRNVLREAIEKMPKKADVTDVEVPSASKNESPPEDTDRPETPASWLPDWRPLAVGAGAGFVLGMLVLLQLQQIFRRR